MITLALAGAAEGRRLNGGGLQAKCNPNKNNKDCKKGFECQPIFGSPNQKGQCIPTQDKPTGSSCWIGPGCTSTAIGIIPAGSNMKQQKAKNCFYDKRQCKKNNEPSPPATDVCFSNKGGMCVALNQKPGNYGQVAGQCYATKQQCNQAKNNNKPNKKCFANKRGQCRKQDKKPSGDCYATKKQCNEASKPSNSVCFQHKGGKQGCKKENRAPGGKCYATKNQCEKANTTPAKDANPNCLRCIRGSFPFGGNTWCWKDYRCYPTGSPFNPCNPKNCASISPASSCNAMLGNCIPPKNA